MGKGNATAIVARDQSELSKPLSTAEEARFEQLDTIVREGAVGVFKMGIALAEIRDRLLFRGRFRTFERYLKEVHDMARIRAYQIMDAAEVRETIVNNCLHLNWVPQNEAQARPLARIVRSNQGLLPEVIEMVVDSAKNGKVTASAVNRCAKAVLGEQTRETIKKTRTAVSESRKVSALFKEAFDAFVREIERTRDEGYQTTSREQVVQHLDAIRAVLADDGVAIKEPEFTGGHQNANKLEKAGFNLFRMEEASMNIKIRGGGGWPKHSGPYPTKTAMQAAFAELMQDHNNLAG